MDEEDIAFFAEDVQTESPAKKIRHRKKQLYQTILQQMEFYFGDANLTKDRFMGRLIERDKYIDLEIFLSFNKIRCLTSNVKDIAKALQKSKFLNVSEDGNKVCRVTPVRQKENEDECTIYVEQLPPDAQHDWLKEVFSAYGNVAYVSIPKYKSGKIKGFAFVEFDTPETANKTLEAFGDMGCCLPTQMPPEQLCSITTFETEKLEGTNERDNMKGGVKEDVESIKVEVEPKLGHVKSEKSSKRKRRKDKVDIDDDDNDDDSEMPIIKEHTESISTEEKQEETEGEKSGKKKRKRGNEITTNNDEVQNEPNFESPMGIEDVLEILRKRKICRDERRRRDAFGEDYVKLNNTDGDQEKETCVKLNNTDDDQEKETEEDMEVAEHGDGDDDVFKKKKNRKHKTKIRREKHDMEISKIGLKILSKREWKRLRNKYLELQRSKMKVLKQQLNRARWGSSSKPHHWKEMMQHGARNGQDREHVEENDNAMKSTARTTYTPGVIIHVHLDDAVSDIKKFKGDAKIDPDIKYIDIQEGACEAYIRCSTAEAAEKLVSEKKWEHMTVLAGESEAAYWEKIKNDREEKLGKKIRVKQRGRPELLKKAERELGKHIRFDE